MILQTWLRIWTEQPIREADPLTQLRIDGVGKALRDKSGDVVTLVLPTRGLAGWDGYLLYLFGRNADAPSPDWPWWQFTLGDELEGARLTLQTWDQRAHKPGHPMFARVRWRPSTGITKSIETDSDDWDDRDLKVAAYALRRLHGRRRRGGVAAMSDEDAFEEAVRFGVEWLTDHPGKHPKDFGIPQLAAKRCTGIDATKTWMTRKRFGIRRVQREIARRVGWPT